MWNLHDDNELDKLSRDAAEEYSMDRSPDSWNKLHARLDAEMPQQRRRRYLLFFLLFLFVGSGGFWLSRMNTADADVEILAPNPSAKNKQTETKASTSTEVSAPKNTTLPETSANNEKKEQDVILEKAERSSTHRTGTNTPTSLNNLSANNISHDNIAKKNKPVIVASASGGIYAMKNKKNRSVSQQITEPADRSKKSADKNSPTTDVRDESNSSVVEQPSSPSVAEEKKVDQPAEQKTNTQESQVNQQTTTDPIEKSGVQKSNSKWTFSVAYAPDISTVKFTHTQSPGVNFGAFADYKLSNRWSLQAGVIYTKKNYKMNGEDFHPPKGGWLEHVKLEDVTGSCYMIDFPLNVRYNAVRKKTSNIFFGAGLSSYLMKKEEYHYYGYYYGNPVNSSRTYEGSEGYILSILNVSVGYEKKLSNAFSMQVEPFFKQTLKGVGFGDISLNSTGVYFSLRYNPIKIHKTNTTTTK